MQKNMGLADRTIRMIIAAVVVNLYYTKILTGTVGIALLVLAGIFVLTSLIGFCPLYKLVGWNTCRVRKTEVADQ